MPRVLELHGAYSKREHASIEVPELGHTGETDSPKGQGTMDTFFKKTFEAT